MRFIVRKLLAKIAKICIAFGVAGLSLLLCESILKLSNYQPLPLLVDNDYDYHTAMFPYSRKLIYRYAAHPNNTLPLTPELAQQINLRQDTRANTHISDATFTILTIGDSFTYGHLVSDQHTYPAQIEAILLDQGYDINVLNAGVSGYGIDQEYVLAKEILHIYQPDLVLININVNDADDSNDNCLFRINKTGDLIQVPGFTSNIFIQSYIIDHSPKWLHQSALLNLALSKLSPQNARVNYACTQRKPLPEVAVSVKKMQKLIQHLESELPPKTRLLITLMPTQSYFSTQPNSPLLDYLEVHQSVVSVFTEQNFLDLNQIIKDSYPLSTHNDRTMFLADEIEESTEYGLNHLNTFGSETAAHIIADKIVQEFSLPRLTFQPINLKF